VFDCRATFRYGQVLTPSRHTQRAGMADGILDRGRIPEVVQEMIEIQRTTAEQLKARFPGLFDGFGQSNPVFEHLLSRDHPSFVVPGRTTPGLPRFSRAQAFGKEAFPNAKTLPVTGLRLRHRRRALGRISEQASMTVDMGKFRVLATSP
jgi:hypothetical protein